MITKVTLKNFQVHRHLEVELGPFTVFSGPSNSGKSAVLRALAAMMRNDSPGDYITYGQKSLSVEVETADGHTVLWEKGGTKNDYTLTRPDGTKSSYKKVGASVPEEITEVLRFAPITLEDGKTKVHLNLHEQQESPFLVVSPPPYVAKVFGEMTSAGKLFSAASEGNRRTREEKKVKTLREADIASVRAELIQYEHIAEQKERLQCVTDKVTKAKQLSDAVRQVETAIGLHAAALSGLKTAETTIARLVRIETIDTAKISSLDSAVGLLSSLISDRAASSTALDSLDETLPGLEKQASVDLQALTDAADEARAVQTLLRDYEALSDQLEALPGAGEPVEVDIETLIKLNEAITSVQHLREQYWDAHEGLEVLDGQILETEVALKEAQEALASIDTCPTCGQEIDEDAAKHLTGANHV